MNEKSQQIDSRLNVLLDCDQPLSPAEIRQTISRALRDCRDVSLEEIVIGRARKGILCRTPDAEHVFLTAAVTFLGGRGNHPLFKKRIQLPNAFKEECSRLSGKGAVVHFLGVYHYSGNIVFVDFGTDTYMRRKMHNSSAFVYVNDLFRAMKDGVAHRIDCRGNSITAIRYNCFADYILGSCRRGDDELIEVFEGFNAEFPFSEWVTGQQAIHEMQEGAWSKWRETEWAGWLLEYRFSAFLSRGKIESVVYRGNDGKKEGELDFDLLFPQKKFYGDLKASDAARKEAPGNDRVNLLQAIDRYDRFWYVIYEHETEKDRDCGNPVTRYRAELIFKVTGEAIDPLSYAGRMKSRVCFTRMMILEVNRGNIGDVLADFHQGRQPDGTKRKVKVLINKRNIDNFLVYHYEKR